MRWESPVSAGGPQTPHIPGPEGRFCTPRAQDGRRDPPVCTVNALCWADYMVRNAQGWAGGTKGGSSNQAAVRARLLYVPAHTSVLQNIPLYVHCTTKAAGAAFLCGGNRRYRRGVRRCPISRGRRGASAPRPAPLLPRSAGTGKWIKWCSSRRPPSGWHTPGRPRPRPGFPGCGPKVFPPVSSPGGWLGCSLHVI